MATSRSEALQMSQGRERIAQEKLEAEVEMAIASARTQRRIIVHANEYSSSVVSRVKTKYEGLLWRVIVTDSNQGDGLMIELL